MSESNFDYEEAKKTLAFIYKRLASTRIAEDEMSMFCSMDMKWFKPDDANKFISNAIAAELIKEAEPGVFSPNFDITEVDFDLEFKPSEDLLDLPPHPVEGGEGLGEEAPGGQDVGNEETGGKPHGEDAGEEEPTGGEGETEGGEDEGTGEEETEAEGGEDEGTGEEETEAEGGKEGGDVKVTGGEEETLGAEGEEGGGGLVQEEEEETVGPEIFTDIIAVISQATGMGKSELVSLANEISREKSLTSEAAALVLGRKKGVDVSSFYDRAVKRIKQQAAGK